MISQDTGLAVKGCSQDLFLGFLSPHAWLLARLLAEIERSR